MAIKLSLKDVKSLLDNPASCVKKKETDIVICLHPMYAGDIKEGITQELDNMASRYCKLLSGIPIGYEKVRVSPTGVLLQTDPFLHYRVHATFYVFMPEVGNILEGKIQKIWYHNLSCLVHGLFNVSVPCRQDKEIESWETSTLQEGEFIPIVINDVDMSYYLPMITGALEKKFRKKLLSRIAVANTKVEETDATDPANAPSIKETEATDSGDSGITSDIQKVKKKKKKSDVAQEGLPIKIKQEPSDDNEASTSQDKKKSKKESKKKRTSVNEEQLQDEIQENAYMIKNEFMEGDSEKKKKKDKSLKKEKRLSEEQLEIEIRKNASFIKKEPLGEDSEQNIIKKKKKRKTNEGLNECEVNTPKSPKKKDSKKNLDSDEWLQSQIKKNALFIKKENELSTEKKSKKRKAEDFTENSPKRKKKA